MPAKIGNLDLKKAYAGSTPIKALYAGSTKIWSSEPQTSIPGLTLWFDASKQAAADGERLYAVPDFSSANRVPAWPAGNEPIFRTNAGGRPAYDWISGYAYGMDCGTWNPGTTGLTFIYVGPRPGGTYPMMVVWGPDADGFEMRHDGSSCQVVLRYTTYGIAYSTGLADNDGKDHIYSLVVPAAPGITQAWLDSTKATPWGSVDMPNTTQALYVGRRQGGYPVFGLMREVLVYAGPLSDADMNTLIAHLKEKWGTA